MGSRPQPRPLIRAMRTSRRLPGCRTKQEQAPRPRLPSAPGERPPRRSPARSNPQPGGRGLQERVLRRAYRLRYTARGHETRKQPHSSFQFGYNALALSRPTFSRTCCWFCEAVGTGFISSPSVSSSDLPGSNERCKGGSPPMTAPTYSLEGRRVRDRRDSGPC